MVTNDDGREQSTISSKLLPVTVAAGTAAARNRINKRYEPRNRPSLSRVELGIPLPYRTLLSLPSLLLLLLLPCP